MAEAILKSFDKDLKICSAGIDPAEHVSPIAIEVMKEIGIDLEPGVPKTIDEIQGRSFDFLITVGESTREEIEIPENLNYRRKLHPGFRSPYRNSPSQDDLRKKCREVRDELVHELDYFYNRIIKKSVG